jgi:hypothetical protein
VQRSAFVQRTRHGTLLQSILLAGAEGSATVEGVLLAFETCLNGPIHTMYIHKLTEMQRLYRV